MSECYYDAAGCLVCPEQDAQAYVPARIEQQAELGWNAGADSIDALDDDLNTVFDMPMGVVGVVIGLKGGRSNPTVPGLIEHGWYFQKQGGVNVCQPIERGTPIGTPFAGRVEATSFEIRRVGSTVTYLRDGALVATSTTPSHGPKVVNTCLYASSDSVPSGG